MTHEEYEADVAAWREQAQRDYNLAADWQQAADRARADLEVSKTECAALRAEVERLRAELADAYKETHAECDYLRVEGEMALSAAESRLAAATLWPIYVASIRRRGETWAAAQKRELDRLDRLACLDEAADTQRSYEHDRTVN